jgi:Kef-type K+ transport system membrane component KefB
MLFEIAVALITAKIMGYLFGKVGQPGVLGEIVAGLILGPFLIGSLSGSSIELFGTSLFEFHLDLTTPEFKEISFIGIIFLLFIIGLETKVGDLKKTGVSGLSTAIFSTVFPFIFGVLFGYFFGLDFHVCLAIGTIFYATSMTITMRTLSDAGLLSTRVGLTLQTAGIFSDIFGLFIFSIILGQGHPLVFVLKLLIFVIIILVVGFLTITYAGKKGVTNNAVAIVLPVCFMICFLLAAFAEDIGLIAIMGAFIAGLIVGKTPQAGLLSNSVRSIGYMFFIPLFFVWIGASFNFTYLFSSNDIISQMIFIVFFVILCLVGNFVGGAIGARLAGLKKKESISVGIGMMPIMGMALIIVTTSIDKGIFGDPLGTLALQIKTATILVIIVSFIVTPPLLKKSMNTSYIKKSNKTVVARISEKINESFPVIALAKHQVMDDTRAMRFLFRIFLIITIINIILLVATRTYDTNISELFAAIIGITLGTSLACIIIKYMLRKLLLSTL